MYEFSMHNELSPQTEDRSGRSWDRTIRCSCGEFESKSRAEHWAHASMALRGELAAAVGLIEELTDDPGTEYGSGGSIDPAPDAATPLGNSYEYYSVVNAEAGVWRCDRCTAHVASPTEHNQRCPRMCPQCGHWANLLSPDWYCEGCGLSSYGYELSQTKEPLTEDEFFSGWEPNPVELRAVSRYLETAAEQGEWSWADHCEGLAGGILHVLHTLREVEEEPPVFWCPEHNVHPRECGWHGA